MAKSLEDLKVYQKSIDAAKDISAILRRPALRRDVRLHRQIGASSERVASLIAEGSQQSTDRHFAEYLYRARGSTREVRTQLVIAVQRDHVPEDERQRVSAKYEEIAKMLTGLIRYLEGEDRKDRR